MLEIVPLAEWYPAMAAKWEPLSVPRSEREAWVVHHTDGGASSDPLAYARGVADDHWGKWERPGGYSFLVGTDGLAREMCGFDARGVHAGSRYWNYHGLALAFQGNFNSSPPSDLMLETGAEVIAMFPLPQSYHRAVRPTYTDCPGDALIRLLPLEDTMPAPKDWDSDDLNAVGNAVLTRFAVRDTDGNLVLVKDAIQTIYQNTHWTRAKLAGLVAGSASAGAIAVEIGQRLIDGG